jgi:hypothetical protein
MTRRAEYVDGLGTVDLFSISGSTGCVLIENYSPSRLRRGTPDSAKCDVADLSQMFSEHRKSCGERHLLRL